MLFLAVIILLCDGVRTAHPFPLPRALLRALNVEPSDALEVGDGETLDDLARDLALVLRTRVRERLGARRAALVAEAVLLVAHSRGLVRVDLVRERRGRLADEHDVRGIDEVSARAAATYQLRVGRTGEGRRARGGRRIMMGRGLGRGRRVVMGRFWLMLIRSLVGSKLIPLRLRLLLLRQNRRK